MSPNKPLILVCVPLWPTPDDVLPFFKARLAGKDLPPQKPRDAASLDVKDGKLEYEVKYYPTPNEKGEGKAPTEEEWKRCQALVCLQIPECLESTKQVPSLRLVQLSSAGVGHVETTAFYRSIPKDSDLIVCSASGIHVVPISEHVIATTMALYHNFPKFILSGAEDPPRWIRMPELGNGGFVVRELRGRTIGLLGYGHIARETARMAQALGMRVTCATRTGHATPIAGYLLPSTGDPDGKIPEKWYTTTSADSLAEFYATADVVVNSLPSTDETKGFVGDRAFRDMRDDGVFVNIGRGDTVDQDVMIQALEAGLQASSSSAEAKGKPNGNLQISAASLDVTSPEPLPPTNKLWRLPNVLLTPHMSGGSELYWYRVTDLASINVRRVLEQGLGGLNAVRGKGE
ncbi:hypothetical protein QFC22_004658 [Naganishia vaughanmartiniae]|uniref:Uncharacterized protein n=1 Tax=Naganishia vaughanmartiniae TaxID=1424756 RepID=A0ACC2X0S5_9TREE|nr:hypothetical protein QFC22_004658 [Naganishia vaughanmartiniae]